jgi:hypothetical protein
MTVRNHYVEKKDIKEVFRKPGTSSFERKCFTSGRGDK